jgi:hypothetical protein
VHGTALKALAEAMWGQENVDIGGSLLLRLARFLGGDAAQWILVTSASTAAPVGLPDNTNAMSATLHVTGNPIQYRVDGSAPVATDPVLPVGTIITLTGRPTIQSFRFVSTVATAASLVGAYYD